MGGRTVEAAGGAVQGSRGERSIGIALCGAVVLGWAVEQLSPTEPVAIDRAASRPTPSLPP